MIQFIIQDYWLLVTSCWLTWHNDQLQSNYPATSTGNQNIIIIHCNRNLRKRFLYIAIAGIFLLFHLDSFGQKQKPKNDSWYDDKKIHFGFSLGLNLMDFDITPSKTPLAIRSPEIPSPRSKYIESGNKYSGGYQFQACKIF